LIPAAGLRGATSLGVRKRERERDEGAGQWKALFYPFGGSATT